MNIVIQSCRCSIKFRACKNVRVTLEFKEVLAARKRLALSFRSTGVEISVRYSTAFADALKKDSATMVG